MNVVSHCPLQVLGFVWQSRTGTFAQTVIVKATYVLRPGECVLAPEQAPVNEDDVPWDDDPAGSAYAPSDLAPLKPKAEVMLVGYAFAPGQQPVRSVTTRLIVGELDKSIEVWCDRGFRVRDGQLLEGPGLTRMPLRWERAAGGPETGNPVGMRFDAAPDKYEMIGVPNLQPPGLFVSQRADVFAPVCFAPVAARWPGRAAKLGRLAGTFPLRGWEAHPLPEELDYGYFQAAPADQQVSEIRPNERIVLENLLLEHPRLVTCLPGIRPRAVAERGMGQRDDVALVADTLWIDAARGICTVVWRGRLGIRSAGEVGRIVVSLERGTDAVKPEGERERGLVEVDLEQTAALDPTLMTMAPGLRPAVKPVMPFLGGYEPSSPPVGGAPAARGSDAGLPFVSQAVPFASTDEDVPTAIGVPRPQLLEAVAPAFARTPWGSAAKDPVQALTVGQSMSVAPVETPRPALAMSAPALVRAEPAPALVLPAYAPSTTMARSMSSASSSWAPQIPAQPFVSASKGKSLVHDAKATLGGVASASDAAALSIPRIDAASSSSSMGAAASPRVSPSEYVDLLWFNKQAPQRVRQQSGWAEQMRAPQRQTEWIVGEAPEEPTQIVVDRRDIRRALGRIVALDAIGIARAMEEAIDADGILERPLVVVNGELSIAFDPLEALKATLIVAAQLASADKRLKDTLDAAGEVAQGRQGVALPLVEAALTRVRQAFAQANHSLPVDYLEATVERILIEERHYLKRKLFGGPHLVGLLATGTKSPLPMYLPEHLAEHLPLFPKFRIRVIAEPHLQQDPAESEPLALLVLALGRSMSAPSTRGRRQT